MLFNSFPFLVFLSAAVLAHHALPPRHRWAFLLTASYAFYGLWNPGAVLWLVFVTLVAYTGALALTRFPEGQHAAGRRAILAVALLLDLGSLFLLKYFDFFALQAGRFLTDLGRGGDNVPQLGWLLPTGLSFFTFSAASYLIDVYREKLPAERHLGHMALYVAFFPKIFAGPIERATRFLSQLDEKVGYDPVRVAEGAQLILWGLFKKVVVADRLLPFVDAAYNAPAFATPMQLIVGTYFYAFQIYADFSGYTDIATGAAKLLGFDFAPNFRRPYLSRSPVEFWGRGRWHISLGTWFRDYLYIPLGGSRVGIVRRYLNTMIVFLVSGLWHAGLVGGAMNWTFLLWGAINGGYQWVSMATSGLWRRLGERLPRVGRHWAWNGLRILWTFHLITFAWVFFRAQSIADASLIVSRIWSNLGRLPTLVRFYDVSLEFFLSLALIAVLMLVEVMDEHRGFWEHVRSRPTYVRWSLYYGLILALVILGKWGLAEFVYMQF